MWFSVSAMWLHELKVSSITSAYPATSCSSRVAKEWVSRRVSSSSTWRSVSRLHSMRVEDPMLSMVATRRMADNRSGARVQRARQAPLNSSTEAIRDRMSGVMEMVPVLNMSNIVSIYVHFSSGLACWFCGTFGRISLEFPAFLELITSLAAFLPAICCIKVIL